MIVYDVGDRPEGLTFGGLMQGRQKPAFPRWMHKDAKPPRLVNNTDEAEAANAEGFDNITAAGMSNKHLINWFWDLEDMSPRQLVVFAKDEYGVDLPIEAGQETLFQAVVELTRHAPQNRNRLVLMAHTIRMEYDATLEEIRRMIGATGEGYECETITEEVWL